MNYTVGTLQELVDVIPQITEQSTINITEYLEITEPIVINNDNVIYIDLNENTLAVYADNAFVISGGEIWITNGIIDGDCSNLISIEGIATVVLYDNLSVSNTGTIANVGKKGQLYINGAEVHCTSENPAISVEGYTRATDNSKFIMMTGYLTSTGTSIEVSKRGIANIQGGNIYSKSSVAISKADDTATKVEISGGLIKGSVPEGSIELSYYDASINTDGYLYVTPKETTDESIVEADIETDDTPSTNEPIAEEPIVEETVEDTESSEPEESVVEESPVVDEPIAETPIEEVQEETPVVEEPIVEEPKRKVVVEQETETPVVNDTQKSVTSTILKKSTRVYRIPNSKYLLTSIIGAVTILGGEFTDPNTKEVYTKISFKLPGNGIKAIGYVIASNLGRKN